MNLKLVKKKFCNLKVHILFIFVITLSGCYDATILPHNFPKDIIIKDFKDNYNWFEGTQEVQFLLVNHTKHILPDSCIRGIFYKIGKLDCSPLSKFSTSLKPNDSCIGKVSCNLESGQADSIIFIFEENKN